MLLRHILEERPGRMACASRFPGGNFDNSDTKISRNSDGNRISTRSNSSSGSNFNSNGTRNLCHLILNDVPP